MEADQPLLEARQSEPHFLAEIHDRYYPVVYRYVRYRLDDEGACEDIAAEVFLRLVDALQRKHAEIQSPRAWLLGTASHLVNDHLRARYHHPLSPLDDLEIAGHDLPEETIEQKTHHQTVREAMQRLTADQQNVLALRFAEEYSLEETAQVMGKTVGAVKTLQFRALGTLRRLLSMKEKQ